MITFNWTPAPSSVGRTIWMIGRATITFSSVVCAAQDLGVGLNLVGFACAGESYGAFDLLNALGMASASSVQRYDTEAGRFETALFDSTGDPAGVNFPIVPGEGYLLHMKQFEAGFVP